VHPDPSNRIAHRDGRLTSDRAASGLEVGVMIGNGARQLPGVGAAATVNPGHLRRLRRRANQAGEPFQIGLALYDEPATVLPGGGIWAAPLWSPWAKAAEG